MISPPPHRPARMFGARPLSHHHLYHLLITTLLLLLLPFLSVESSCNSGCPVALASYYISPYQNLTYVASLFGYVLGNIDPDILPYNRNITSKDSIPVNTRVNIPFPCDCIGGAYLGHTFQYKVQTADTYNSIATDTYTGLTTASWLAATNPQFPARNIWVGTSIDVTVNCSCGDAKVSENYGLFATYPLRQGQTLESVAREVGLPDAALLQEYNPGLDFSSGSGIAFVPAKDRNGNFSRLTTSTGGPVISRGAIAGISVAAVVTLILVAGISIILRRRKTKKVALPAEDPSSSRVHEVEVAPVKNSPITRIVVEKIVKFSLEELKKATNNFSMECQIGQGGFGTVYYANLRGEKTAIKKMDMKASRMFLAELQVLSRVHHLNLVHLIGYCTKDSLFLVYEYIENGSLNQHLHGSGNKAPLPWSTRVQIALDSARGLEYIHEHAVPGCTHFDIKSANILIDKNYHAKVADFGLAQFTKVRSLLQSKMALAGTRGYMAPEYFKYGEVSPGVDVYAFGVVLYELISAQEAVVKTNALAFATECKALVYLFEEVLTNPDPREDLHKLVDPRLADDYPTEAVYKLAQIAKACTQMNPQLRPSMRSVVVALMSLSSSTEELDVGQLFENQGMAPLMSGDADAFY